MNPTIIVRTPTSFTLQIEVPYNDSMLDFEECTVKEEGLRMAGDLVVEINGTGVSKPRPQSLQYVPFSGEGSNDKCTFQFACPRTCA
ncbi:hypothetical protein V5E97_15025 [Singulisphaera sp. Ch08]|uniref:Uncharacterized protein n=1 Tax=Singulisphaera sp. Ch08 TaxID=3120278 RepID=A0AAU7CPT2_9BACT